MFIYNQNWRALIVQTLLINLVATLVAISFNASAYGFQTFFSSKEIVTSFVYSNCIGTFLLVVIVFFVPRWGKDKSLKRLLKVTASIFFGTFFGVITARLILAVIFPELYSQGLLPSWQNFVFSLGIAFTIGFGVYFYEISQFQLAETTEKLRQKELQEAQTKTLAAEAQLASLESRIHPHFLFNTLNSIASLIREEPVLAEKMIEKLSSLLRYSLDSNSKSLVFLDVELEIVEKYLQIEKIRFAERLIYEIHCESKFKQVKLPPLALQTLIENSVKHVASQTSEQTSIVVSVIEKDQKVKIEVKDNGSGFTADNIKNGHGLDNLQKRLQTIFQGEASLEVQKNGTVCLYLPKNYEKVTGFFG